MTVVIESVQGDLHAIAVKWAVHQMGQQCELLASGGFPRNALASYHLAKSGSVKKQVRALQELCLDNVFTVWHRRNIDIELSENLHPDDRVHAKQECRAFLGNFCDHSDSDIFEANSPAAARRANHKLIQLERAVRQGLQIPETLASNDPETIREFHCKVNGRILYKPFTPFSWRSSDRVKEYGAYASIVDDNNPLDAESLRSAPGIFQEYVEKAYEVRVLVVDKQMFAVKIESQQADVNKVDWRVEPRINRYAPYSLPPKLRKQVESLLSGLGLVTGSLDFIVTPSGEYYFLEINQAGQFLFMELHVPELPILGTFADFLISRNESYEGTSPCKSTSLRKFFETPEYATFYNQAMN